MSFETARMVIKSWDETLNNDDQRRTLVDDLKEVLTPAVLQHLPEPLWISDTETSIEDWIAERAKESDVKLVRDRVADSMLGLLILAEFADPEAPISIHIGYLFPKMPGGKGMPLN